MSAQSILYILLAILGLNILVFIHELGHYIVARRNKMKVEVFSIGFGKPLFSWMRKGVKWQLCPLLFGGYVRIAGMEKEGELEPYEVPEGFYSKSPWARIKVALAGPLVNLGFALLLFTLIWWGGGRQKPFSEFTQIIGYLDPQSELYHKGVRPGDLITQYNAEKFNGYKDLIYAALLDGHPASIEGEKVDYYKKIKTPYDYTVVPYESPAVGKGMKTVGIFSPASYLIYQAPTFRNLPLSQSGIRPSDRIVWVNGELIFSNEQLGALLNNGRALLTIERGGELLLVRVPRLPLSDLQLNSQEEGELSDWLYAANLHLKEESPLFIPYSLSYNLEVEASLLYVDERAQLSPSIPNWGSRSLDIPLQVGDRICAIDGIPVATPIALIKALQTPRALMIIKREEGERPPISWKEEDQLFVSGTDWEALTPIIQTIGTSSPLKESAHFHLLNPITPIRLKEFPLSKEDRAAFHARVEKQQEAIEKISDPSERERAERALEDSLNRRVLGLSLTDRLVNYNPNPFTLFVSVFQEVGRNLIALVSGSVSPKQFGGPLFIVQVMQQSWGIGFKEALFWLGTISLNLGILNLLPIPVLDGGHICFALIEKVRKKPLKARTMQRLILPFVALLIALFVYLTYNDLIRIFGRLF